MGYIMRDAFVKFEDCRDSWLHEREFVEAARALKSLAADMGEDVGPAVEALVRHGAETAFAVLHAQSATKVSDASLRLRVH